MDTPDGAQDKLASTPPREVPDDGHDAPATDGKSYWLDNPRNVDRIFYALCAVCAAVVVADLFYAKHGHFNFEQITGFHGGFGFLAYVGLVLTATQLRRFLKRDEDYYE